MKFLFSFSLDPYFDSFSSRVYPPIISLPFCFLIWIISEHRVKSWKLSISFLIICFLGFSSLTFYRIRSDFQFYKNNKNFSNQLSKCKGVFEYELLDYNLNRDSEWNITSKSLFYPKKRNISTLLINGECFDTCREKGLSVIKCENRCNNWSYYFPKKILESNFKLEQRFFNFKPLYGAYSKGVSTCSKEEP